MMKKRHDEGFALAYVVIVIFILCALSIALMSMTLRTLQAQEASVKRMQDKYAAQGEIERLVAELDSFAIPETSEKFSSSNSRDSAAKSRLSDFITSLNSSDVSILRIDTGNTDEYVYALSAKANDTSVNSEISIIPNIIPYDYNSPTSVPEYDLNGNLITDYWYEYSIDVTNITFITYEITTEGGDP